MKQRKRDPEAWAKVLKAAMDVKSGRLTWDDVERISRDAGIPMNAAFIRQGSTLLFAGFDNNLLIMDESAPTVNEAVPHKLTQSAEECCSEFLLTQDRLVTLYERGGAGTLSKAKVRDFFGLSDEFEIKTVNAQAWHSAVKGGGKQLLYNLKVITIPRGTALTTDDIDQFFKRLPKNPLPAVPLFKKKKTNKTNKAKAKTFLEIDLSDVHVGLLAWKPETGEHYDLAIAKNLVLSLMQDITERYANSDIDEVVLVTMGDILHVDNGKMETTHGTRQDVEGRVPKMVDTAAEMLVSSVRILEQLKVPIKYVYVPGNHDTNTGYMLAKLVEALLARDKNVSFDTTPEIFKCLNYGATVVGVAHGEANDKRAPLDLLTRHRYEYGQANAAEVHLGHLHSERVKEVTGVMVYRVPAVCESSYWEKSMGYPAIGRGIQTFVYQKDIAGYIGIGRHYIDAYK